MSALCSLSRILYFRVREEIDRETSPRKELFELEVFLSWGRGHCQSHFLFIFPFLCIGLFVPLFLNIFGICSLSQYLSLMKLYVKICN